MKKIYGLMFIVLLASAIVLVALSSIRRVEERLYILPQAKSYICKEGERLSFEIYSNRRDSILFYPEQNTYQLVSNSAVYTLKEVHVEKLLQKEMTLFIITAALPPIPEDTLYLDEGILRIENSVFTGIFEFGSLSILKPEGYALLGVDDFYASYAYIDGVLQLVGLNITFSKIYQTISALKVGSSTRADLTLAQKDMKCPNEVEILQIVPNYQIEIEEREIPPLLAESRTYFFPMVYDKLLVIRQGFITAQLDGIWYYIDTFTFIVNELDYAEYQPALKRGGLEYAVS